MRPDGDEPARGEIMELNLRKGFGYPMAQTC